MDGSTEALEGAGRCQRHSTGGFERDGIGRLTGFDAEFVMEPGTCRSKPEYDVAIGRHIPPSSHRVDDFLRYFQERYGFKSLKTAGLIMAIAAAHHRFNYIHPFPDEKGRDSRLMSHAMAQLAGIGSHELWSISRGLARGLKALSEYKRMMDLADMPCQGDFNGRGNLSLKELNEFVLWFLQVCLDQVEFMDSLFELDSLGPRLIMYVERSKTLKPEAKRLLEEALIRGQFERGDVARITGLPERSARRILSDVIAEGLLGSETPKSAVSLTATRSRPSTFFPKALSRDVTRRFSAAETMSSAISPMPRSQVEGRLISDRMRVDLGAAKARGAILGGARGRAGTCTDLAKARPRGSTRPATEQLTLRQSPLNFGWKGYIHCGA